MNKYNQSELNKLIDYFANEVKAPLFSVYASGILAGKTYVTIKHVPVRKRDIVEDFCVENWQTNFKAVQISFNEGIRKGRLTPSRVDLQPSIEFSVQPEKTTTNNSNMANTIVRLSRLVADKQMTPSEFEEIICNIYS